MPDSFITQITEAFKKMDINAVSDLLDDDKTYLELPKKTFLDKLNNIFEWLKRNGDKKLIAIPGEKETHRGSFKKGSKGYGFKGDKTDQFFEMIFIEKRKQLILASLDYLEKPAEFVLENRMFFFIMEDEKVSFVPDKEYIRKAEIAKMALEDLDPYIDEILPYSVYTNWLLQYQSLYDVLEVGEAEHLVAFNHFYYLHEAVLKISLYYGLSDEAKEAAQCLSQIGANEEVLLMRGLLDYYELYQLLPDLTFCFGDYDLQNDPTIRFYKYKLKTTDVYHGLQFVELYEAIKERLKKKYTSGMFDLLDKLTVKDKDKIRLIRKCKQELYWNFDFFSPDSRFEVENIFCRGFFKNERAISGENSDEEKATYAFLHQMQIKNEKCVTAVTELEENVELIDSEILFPWLNRHRSLYASVKNSAVFDYQSAFRFVIVYGFFELLMKFSEKRSLAIRAIVNYYENVFLYSEDTIAEWIEEYGLLKDYVDSGFFSHFYKENYKEKKHFYFQNLKVSMQEVNPFLDLKTCFLEIKKNPGKFKPFFDESEYF